MFNKLLTKVNTMFTINLTDNKKPQRSSNYLERGPQPNLVSDSIMEQQFSHSNTPEFTSNKSQTSARLYQHPTAEEMKPSKAKKRIGDFFAIALLISIFFGLALMAFYKHAEQMDRQTVVAIKGGV